jgi:hypothetical protein
MDTGMAATAAPQFTSDGRSAAPSSLAARPARNKCDQLDQLGISDVVQRVRHFQLFRQNARHDAKVGCRIIGPDLLDHPLPCASKSSARAVRKAADSRSRAPFRFARPGLSALNRVAGLGLGFAMNILQYFFQLRLALGRPVGSQRARAAAPIVALPFAASVRLPQALQKL